MLLSAVCDAGVGEVPVRAGASSTTAWVRELLNLSPAAVARRTKTARAVRSELTATGAALAAGEIGYEQTAVSTRAVTDLPADLDPPEDVDRGFGSWPRRTCSAKRPLRRRATSLLRRTRSGRVPGLHPGQPRSGPQTRLPREYRPGRRRGRLRRPGPGPGSALFTGARRWAILLCDRAAFPGCGRASHPGSTPRKDLDTTPDPGDPGFRLLFLFVRTLRWTAEKWSD
ncbi:MAG: DUF222 domain-containing protein [Geodermatophilaceae bacterium]|nr:DUF222 domain-containing protein [Geodermatophilaceae bacterium]